MRKLSWVVFIIFSLSLFIFAIEGGYARQPWPPSGFHSPLRYPGFSMGIGSHVHSYESNKRSDNWNGSALRGTIYINRRLAGQLKYYSTNASIVDYWGNEKGTSDISGMSIAALAGLNWRKGFNLFGGLGIYREDFDWLDYSSSWTGYSIHYGISYRWDILSLELSGEIKDPAEINNFYENELGVTGDSNQVYSSTSLTVGFNF